jgi:hypothetical protein
MDSQAEGKTWHLTGKTRSEPKEWHQAGYKADQRTVLRSRSNAATVKRWDQKNGRLSAK